MKWKEKFFAPTAKAQQHTNCYGICSHDRVLLQENVNFTHNYKEEVRQMWMEEPDSLTSQISKILESLSFRWDVLLLLPWWMIVIPKRKQTTTCFSHSLYAKLSIQREYLNIYFYFVAKYLPCLKCVSLERLSLPPPQHRTIIIWVTEESHFWFIFSHFFGSMLLLCSAFIPPTDRKGRLRGRLFRLYFHLTIFFLLSPFPRCLASNIK